MIIFIDDSGDPGFALEKGASSHFVIACVIFDDELIAEETAVAIKKYRRQLKFPDDVEFKFSKSRDEIKQGFLETINQFNFRVRAIVVDKKLIRSEELHTSKDSFYSYFIKQVLFHSKNTLIDSKIRLDGHGDRLFKKNLTTYLRKELNSEQRKIMKNMSLVDSRSNVLIQMADMIAEAMRRSFDKRSKNKNTYMKIIKNKMEDFWEFE